MNTRGELYRLTKAVNDANFSVQVECIRVYELVTFLRPIPEYVYEDVCLAIEALQIAITNLNTRERMNVVW